MDIRALRHEDERAVLSLWSEVGLASNREVAETEFRLLVHNQPDHCLAAKLSSGLVGCIFGVNEGFRGWLMRLVVANEFRRQGVGTSLVREQERRFRRHGINYISMSVNTDQAAARSFWSALGYVERPDLTVVSRTW